MLIISIYKLSNASGCFPVANLIKIVKVGKASSYEPS